MQKFKSLAVGVGMAIALPALASAVTLEGHFSGHADHDGPAPGEYAAGVTYDAYTVINTTQTNPWFPWDQVSFEYTAVINATVSSYTDFGVQRVVDFGVASVAIYKDAGTAADYANKATFTDGTLVLSGEFQNMIGSHFEFPGLPYDVTGVVVFNGGAELGSLNPACSGGLVANDFINFLIGTNPAGYEEGYDIEWKCTETVGTDESTWGQMKGLYR